MEAGLFDFSGEEECGTGIMYIVAMSLSIPSV
jgi:hypothetical protein